MPTDSYNPARLDIGNEFLDERDIPMMQRAAEHPESEEILAALNRTAQARALTQPEVRSASLIQKFDPRLDISIVAKEMRDQSALVRKGDMGRAESILIAQAHSLDSLFSNLARMAHSSMGGGRLQEADTLLRLGLRAQNQCRMTLESLSTIKNPPVIFAKQMNVAHGHQQVNNGMAAQPDCSRTIEIEKTPTKLGDHNNELLANTQASGVAGRAMPEPQTVGVFDRSEN